MSEREDQETTNDYSKAIDKLIRENARLRAKIAELQKRLAAFVERAARLENGGGK